MPPIPDMQSRTLPLEAMANLLTSVFTTLRSSETHPRNDPSGRVSAIPQVRCACVQGEFVPEVDILIQLRAHLL